MSAQQLVLVVAIGAAAIAIWCDRRLGSRGPRSVIWTLAHVGASLLALQVMPQVITLVVTSSADPSRAVAATLFVLLPVLTYVWLSALWLMKLVQRATQLRP